MRWLSRLRPEKAGTEGKQALERAVADREEIKAKSPEVQRVAASLKKLREDNHFAENIRFLLGGR